MTWQLWVVVGWFVISALYGIGMVGKKREPIEPSTAVTNVIAMGLLVTLVIWGSHA